jgi:hypothetical protein
MSDIVALSNVRGSSGEEIEHQNTIRSQKVNT